MVSTMRREEQNHSLDEILHYSEERWTILKLFISGLCELQLIVSNPVYCNPWIY